MRVLVIILILFFNRISSQDLTNRHLSKVKFRMSFVYNNLPTSACNPNDPSIWPATSDEEWIYNAKISDSPNLDGSGWTFDDCYKRVYNGSGWTTSPDKEFYESPSLSSSNRIEMNYAVSLQVWEDDVSPACDLQNGDQCEWTTGAVQSYYNTLPKNKSDCPNTWHHWLYSLGTSTRYINVEYYLYSS